MNDSFLTFLMNTCDTEKTEYDNFVPPNSVITVILQDTNCIDKTKKKRFPAKTENSKKLITNYDNYINASLLSYAINAIGPIPFYNYTTYAKAPLHNFLRMNFDFCEAIKTYCSIPSSCEIDFSGDKTNDKTNDKRIKKSKIYETGLITHCSKHETDYINSYLDQVAISHNSYKISTSPQRPSSAQKGRSFTPRYSVSLDELIPFLAIFAYIDGRDINKTSERIPKHIPARSQSESSLIQLFCKTLTLTESDSLPNALYYFFHIDGIFHFTKLMYLNHYFDLLLSDAMLDRIVKKCFLSYSEIKKLPEIISFNILDDKNFLMNMFFSNYLDPFYFLYVYILSRTVTTALNNQNLYTLLEDAKTYAIKCTNSFSFSNKLIAEYFRDDIYNEPNPLYTKLMSTLTSDLNQNIHWQEINISEFDPDSLFKYITFDMYTNLLKL